MSEPTEEKIIDHLRETSGTQNAHISIEKRRELFEELDQREGRRLAGWIWKLLGIASLTTACWIAISIELGTESGELSNETTVARNPTTPQAGLRSNTSTSPSLFSIWNETDPIDQSIQELQNRIQSNERLARFSSSIRDSRENDLRRRLQRLKDDLS
ncbi:MAG: hypothetical protein AAGB06_03305 [Verrucomicrobiota bacterium]